MKATRSVWHDAHEIGYDESPDADSIMDPLPMAEYRFLTSWHIEASLHDVYDVIVASLQWPEWWPGVERVEQRDAGDADGIGGVRRYTWKGRLPYQLSFEARTIRVEPHAAVEATVSGDVEGSGICLFSGRDGITTVRYEWHVRTTKPWMNWLAPVARPLFEENHRALMQSGAEGLARVLDARLIEVSHSGVLPTESETGHSGSRGAEPVRPASRRPIHWAAAVGAGIGAGIIATAVQLLLWWAYSIPLPDILLRDTRLAAAIVMGRRVLPPPASFEWDVMLVATLVHFLLSISYGLLMAPLLSRCGLRQALLAGALFGLALYGINLYGFTAVFPWFEASRDWITAAAHVSFGITAAGIYKGWNGMAAAVWGTRNSGKKDRTAGRNAD
jgi:uncharacterized protein YndB with AHSA1/START domain